MEEFTVDWQNPDIMGLYEIFIAADNKLIKIPNDTIFFGAGELYKFQANEKGYSISLHHKLSDYGNMY
jgi:hypothetical protein